MKSSLTAALMLICVLATGVEAASHTSRTSPRISTKGPQSTPALSWVHPSGLSLPGGFYFIHPNSIDGLRWHRAQRLRPSLDSRLPPHTPQLIPAHLKNLTLRLPQWQSQRAVSSRSRQNHPTPPIPVSSFQLPVEVWVQPLQLKVVQHQVVVLSWLELAWDTG